MIGIKNKKKDKAIASIYMTTDYDKFSLVEGNRNIRPHHVDRLCKSFKETQLEVPLVVDRDYRIYDGQNRFVALKSLKLPLYYQIIDGMSLRSLQLLNSNSSNWTTAQYCKSYCELGNPEYIKYRDFKKKYRLGVRESLNLLSGSGMTENPEKMFANGEFVCKDYNNAIKKADMLVLLEPYVKFYRKRNFVVAMVTLFDNKIYDHNRLIKKLKKRSSKLTEQSHKKDYLKILEEMYNWNELKKNKVRLFTY